MTDAHDDLPDDELDDDAFDDEPEDPLGDAAPSHPALDQLDEWEEEAKNAVLGAGQVKGGVSGLDAAIREKLVELRGADIRALIDELKKRQSDLQARMESDDAQGIASTQVDTDELESIDDALDALEDALEP